MMTDKRKLYRATETLFRAFHYLLQQQANPGLTGRMLEIDGRSSAG